MTASSSAGWIRSWNTKTPVGNSSAELETLIRRYKASGYTVSNNYADRRIVVGFTIHGHNINIPVDFGEVGRRLDEMPQFAAACRNRSQGERDAWRLAQAERVAWRQLILFVEAGLNAAAAGIQTIDEAFLAHTIMPRTDGGTPMRVSDFISKAKLLPSVTR